MKVNEKSLEFFAIFGKFALAQVFKDDVAAKKYSLQLATFVLNNPEFKAHIIEDDPGDEPTKKEA